MELLELMKERHSVRSYTDKKIEGKIKEDLEAFIQQCNHESGLHMQLILDEPECFDTMLAHYGKLNNVNNYIALVGKKGADLEEKCGYYGEKIVLYAQSLGLNTCWVALTYSKSKAVFQVNEGEKLCLVIAIGYGTASGKPHKSKSINDVVQVKGVMPDWFKKGVEAALLAPTAMNQQKFTFYLDGNEVHVKAGLGFYSKIDLGIVKYHFETIAHQENFIWK